MYFICFASIAHTKQRFTLAATTTTNFAIQMRDSDVAYMFADRVLPFSEAKRAREGQEDDGNAVTVY